MIIGRFPGGGEDVTAEVNEQTPLIQDIMEALVGKVQGANATADKIIAPYKAYVGQKLITGTAKDPSSMADLLAATGCTKLSINKFTPTSRVTATSKGAINHSLGVQPKFALILSEIARSNNTSYDIVTIVLMRSNVSSAATSFGGAVITKMGMENMHTYTTVTGTVNSSSVTVSDSGRYFTAGIPYTLITMA